MTRAEQLRANAAKYVATHSEKVRARWKAYRQKNRERLLAYQAEYRSKRSDEKKEELKTYMREYNRAYYSNMERPRRVRVLKPRPIQVPRDPHVFTVTPTKIISMYVSCSYCEAKFRRGTPEYYDGTFDRGDFCCGDCGDNLELEA